MNIGILGTGRMGSTLGKIWAQKGHHVFFGTRSIEKAADLAANLNIQAGGYEDAAHFGEIIFIGVPWSATQSTLDSLGSLLDGKIIIDCTNALAADFISLAISPETSAGEIVQAWLPKSMVIKAYNTIGYGVLTEPNYNGIQASGFYCGNNAQAKQKVATLISDSGFDPIDCGDLSQSRNLEAMTLLFINLSFKQGLGGKIAFKLLKH
jgi:8-hydroxy-5-deazaflavin:NADPH oxidoreductase